MLLLHGFPQDRSCWQRVAPALAAGTPSCSATSRATATAARRAGRPARRGLQQARDGRRARRGHGAGRLRALRRRRPRSRRAASPIAWRSTSRTRVERLCVLNVVPTVEQFERMAADTALELLALPPARPAGAVRRAARRRRAPSTSYATRSRRGRPEPGAIDARGRRALRARVHARRRSPHVRGIPGRVPPRPRRWTPPTARRAHDRLPRARALGRRGGRDGRRAAAGLAPLGADVRGGPLSGRPLRPAEEAAGPSSSHRCGSSSGRRSRHARPPAPRRAPRWPGWRSARSRRSR